MADMNDRSQDHIVMRNGRVMMMRNGEMTSMDEEMTLPDGTRVGIDGTMMMPDGTMRMMVEGEILLLQSAPAGPEDMTDRQFTEAMEDEELRDEIE
jgi:hypothetical protein